MGALDRLLRPQSIAVIGGGTWCRNVLRECRKIGFTGQITAVHPARSDLEGCPAVPTVADLPAPPDAAFVGVNRHATVGIVKQLSDIGTGGAICFASGFSEASRELDDGHDLQAGLVSAAGGMPVLGPNCYGFINALDGVALWPDQHGLTPVSSGVAIISQSSNIALNLTMQQRGLPIAYLMTAGNQAQTGLSDIGLALLEDERVTAIGLHIEGLDDLAGFEAFARRARELGKPVAALKIGKSDHARAATISHTASLAGSMAGASALLKRLGIAQVPSLAVLLETLKILHVVGPLPSSRLASMSCSGGEASLMADLASDMDVCFPPLTAGQLEDLRETLGPKVALANPLDYHTYIWGDVDAMSRTFAGMVAGPADLGIVVLDFPRPDRCAIDDWLPVIDAMSKARRLSGKPFALLASLPENLPEDLADKLVAKKIIPLAGMDETLSAIEAAHLALPVDPPAKLHLPAKVTSVTMLDEHQSKKRLSEFGLTTPSGAYAATAREAAQAATQIGFPVALKGTGIAHKTEAGAVVLGLSCPDRVEQAAVSMKVDGYFVEEMVTDVLAELLIGIVCDPAHGLVLTLAAGGVLTELLQDSRSLLVPATRDEIKDELGKLACAKLLHGYRRKPPCDLEAIVDAVMALQEFAMHTPLVEAEINPLLCGRDYAIAADALIKCGDAA